MLLVIALHVILRETRPSSPKQQQSRIQVFMKYINFFFIRTYSSGVEAVEAGCSASNVWDRFIQSTLIYRGWKRNLDS